MRIALVVAWLTGVAGLTIGSAPHALAGGVPRAQGRPQPTHRTPTVRKALSLCSAHRFASYRVQVPGFFVLAYTTFADGGALFDTTEVPVSAAYYYNWTKYGGLSVTVPGRRANQPRSAPRLPHSLTWVTFRGSLVCSAKTPVLLVASWQSALPRPEKPILSIPGVLRVRDALMRCASNPTARYNAQVRGYSTREETLYYFAGTLNDAKAPSATPGLPVVPSIHLSRTASPIADGAWVTVRGLLACVRPPELQMYSWRPSSGT